MILTVSAPCIKCHPPQPVDFCFDNKASGVFLDVALEAFTGDCAIYDPSVSHVRLCCLLTRIDRLVDNLRHRIFEPRWDRLHLTNAPPCDSASASPPWSVCRPNDSRIWDVRILAIRTVPHYYTGGGKRTAPRAPCRAFGVQCGVSCLIICLLRGS